MSCYLSLCECVSAHAHVGACVVFVEFYDVLADLWFIFGLDSAALVLSGYVLFSLVHLVRHLTCPEINTRTHFHTQEATGQYDVFTPEQTGFTPAGSNNSSLFVNQSSVVQLLQL